jgi:gliding motility associated protien GldN
MIKKFLASLVFVALAVGAYAQQDTKNANKYLEYNYEKKEVKERRVLPYPPLREADVIYAKRIERIIDTREKQNMVMAWPKNPLNKVIYDLVTTGEPKSSGKLKAYYSDSLNRTYTIEDVKKLGGSCQTVQIQTDPNDPYSTIDSTVCTPFDYTMIKRFKILEEWIFDKQRSMFFPRIIAIAPMFTPMANGITLSEQPMFYLSYEELRPILIHEEIFNRGNDAQRLTYYDFFEQRYFSSYITKSSNQYDQQIKDFPEYKDNPMEALYASEQAKKELFDWEMTLWEY